MLTSKRTGATELVRQFAVTRYDEEADGGDGRLGNLDRVRRNTYDDTFDALLAPMVHAVHEVEDGLSDDATDDDLFEALKSRLGESPIAQVAWSAANHGVDAEDHYRRRKGAEMIRPSAQLNFDEVPEWLQDDAFIATQDGGRYRAADGKLDDWGPTILEPIDRQVEQVTRKQAEKYATFREMATGLAKGLTNVDSWRALRGRRPSKP